MSNDTHPTLYVVGNETFVTREMAEVVEYQPASALAAKEDGRG